MLEGESKPQEGAEGIVEAGSEEIQPKEELGEVQPGAEGEPQKETTEDAPLTRAEVEKIKAELSSKLNSETAAAQAIAAQAELRAQIAERQTIEMKASIADQKEVDEGTITSTEAQNRAYQRARYQALAPQREKQGKMMAAQDIGERYGVNPYDLLKDQSIRSPQDMEARAKAIVDKTRVEKETAQAKTIRELTDRIRVLEQGGETYLSGEHGQESTKSFEGMAPVDIAREAYGPRETAKRQKLKQRH
uniref:Uncharacterized protein n=1 Tax=viral metagenome TaxID=1070528 RepID=A0A6M3KM38_9ZZZZ